MSRFELHRFDSPEELAETTARRWLEALRAAQPRRSSCSVALSGGRIAGRFFAAVAGLAGQGGGLLSGLDFFWSDERCVPPDDPESNFRLAKEQLLAPRGVPASRIHRIRGELPPEQAAAEAEADLRQFGRAAAAAQPVLDFVFLGLGEEGHIASLFPGEPEALKSSGAVFRSVVASKPPPRRITMGYGTIAAAREVWMLASGADKENALRESLAGGNTPFGRLLGLRERTRIFTDLSAA